MAQVTFTIPDAIQARLLNGFAQQHGYQQTVPDPAAPDQTIQNPETRSQFLRRKTREFWLESVKAAEVNAATQTAATAASADADAILLLTE